MAKADDNGGRQQRQTPAPQRDPARKGALTLLSGVRDGYSLSDQVGRLDRLSPADRARGQRLAAEVLRNIARADHVLSAHLQRKPRPEIVDLLRLATVELLDLNEAPHGAVNAAVGLAQSMGQKGRAASGMVNAVLRKVAAFDGWSDLPPEPLPDWLRRPVVEAYGEAAAKAIEAAHQAGAQTDISLKSGAAVPEGADPLPTGSARLPAGAQITALAGYETGDWWVQDASAAMAARMLDAQPDERVLDLCAAPGGKTLQLAAAGAQVTAVDLSETRMARVRENLDRCGLTARTIVADALKWQPDNAPDAILLDAPCSASGTIRRHPDLPLLRDGTGLTEVTDLQAQLLDHALAILRPGGRLVFATCSLLPGEGEDQIAAALARHTGVTIEKPDLPGIDAAWWTETGLRLRPDYWPDRRGMDGFFIARLRKPA